ncbi:MAG TPA: SMP-30/gluconolactonase/LRE family protein [Pirellulales bacterium]|nr:SMP-30/gluconolactonase/LRE family protein [Pirellulales bacterium]
MMYGSLTVSQRLATGLAALLAVALVPIDGAHGAERQVIADGLENPESAARGHDGRLYVTVIGKSVDGDGTIAVIEDSKHKTFAKGLDDPKGLAAYGTDLYVADKTRVWKIDAAGDATVYAAADAFPTKPKFLNDIEAGPAGEIYVSDCGTFVSDGAVYCIKPSKEISVVVSQKTAPTIKAPNGLLVDGKEHLLLVDFTSGRLSRASLADSTLVELAKGFGGADGLARDAKGRLYVSDWKGGRIFVLEPGADKPQLLAEGFKAAADIYFDAKSGELLVPDTKTGTITALTTAP